MTTNISSSLKTNHNMSKSFRVFAHRFGRKHAGFGRGDENTIELLRAALDRGVKEFEFDVHLVGSQPECDFILFHDFVLDFLTELRGRIESFQPSQLLGVRTKSGGTIVSLNDVIAELSPGCLINIEIKGKHGGKELADILKVYFSQGALRPESVIVSSFYHSALIEFTQAFGYSNASAPKNLGETAMCRVGLLILGLPLYWERALQDTCATSLHIDDGSVDDEVVKQAETLGASVYVYTVNDSQRVAELKAMGVAGVFTDDWAIVEQFSS